MKSMIEALHLMLYKLAHRVIVRHLNTYPHHVVPMIVEMCAFADKHYTRTEFKAMQDAWMKVRAK
jgi:hypothetical protein